MKLRRVISGGQTGADQTGTECAAAMGLETGGTMPRGFRTEVGPRPDWAKQYGLVEHPSSTSYVPRTRQNVVDAEATIWFGRVGSSGYICTHSATVYFVRPFYINPGAAEMRGLAERYEIINVAGNRASSNPQVVGRVREAFAALQQKEPKV